MAKVSPQAQFPRNPLAEKYTRITEESRQRIIAASFGEVGTLKTSFWLTAPGPIVIQSTDKGTEGVVDVYLQNLKAETGKTKEIYVIEYDPSTTQAQEDAIEVRDKFEEDFAYIIQHAKTVVWDKETGVYEIFKYAQFGAPSSNPSDYYALDQRYRHLINLAKDTTINFGLIQGMKDPWTQKVNKVSGKVGAAPSGLRVRRGFREIEEMVHINLEHTLTDGAFYLKIGKSRGPGGRDIQNQTIPYVEFADFAQLVFPESSQQDWE